MKTTGFRILLLSIASIVLAFGFVTHGVSATVPGVNEVANVNTGGGAPDYTAGQQTMSQDGRYVTFSSTATDLVSGITGLTSSYDQVYVRDRSTGTTQLVSIASTPGEAANANSNYPEISANGRYVVFSSTATNLTSTSNDSVDQVYIRDLTNGTTTIVSTNSSGTAGNERSYLASVSADGQFITFTSYSTNLVSGTSATDEVYEKDMATSAINLISENSGTQADSTVNNDGISCEGRFDLMTTQADNLVSGDTSGNWNIYLADRLTGLITDITPDVPSGTGFDNEPSMSCNGNYIVFNTNADNLVSGVTNGYVDTYEYDRIQGTFSLVSVASDGTQPNNDIAGDPTVSNDGRYVAFDSTATNLVSNDTNDTYNVYMHDTLTGTTQMLDVNSSGDQANAYSMEPVISSDGRYVSYQSAATNLVSGFTSSNGLYVSQTGNTDDY